MKKMRALFFGAVSLLLAVLCVLPFVYVLLRSFWTGTGVTLHITRCSSARRSICSAFGRAWGWPSASLRGSS